jgi:hypothetical protein
MYIDIWSNPDTQPKPKIERVDLESLDEIVVAREAVTRAISRLVMSPRYFSDTAKKISRLRPTVRELHAIKRPLFDVITASDTAYDYSNIADHDPKAESHSERYRISVHRGNHPHLLAKAVLDYHKPARDGNDFARDWRVADSVVHRMTEEFQAALKSLQMPDESDENLATISYLPIDRNT